MSEECVRIEVTSLRLRWLRRVAFCDERLPSEERQKAVLEVLPFPADGSSIDLYCDGKYAGKA